MIFRKFRKHNMGRPVYQRIIALVLAVLLMPFTVPQSASAASSERTRTAASALKNHYAVTVTTGVNTSSKDYIKFMAVRYSDTNGSQRKKYIMLSENDMSKGYMEIMKLAKAAGNKDLAQAKLDIVKNATGFSTTAINLKNPFTRKYGTDTFFFETDTEISKITGIDFFVKMPQTKTTTNDKGETEKSKDKDNSWTCQGLRVYKVESLGGMDTAGFYSSEYFVDFAGTLLAQMKTKDNSGSVMISWENDRKISFGNDPNVGEGYISTDFSGAAEDAVKYDSEKSAKEYYIELGIEDKNGSGIDTLINYYSSGSPITMSKMGVYEPLSLRLEYNDIYGSYRTVEVPVVTSAISWAAEKGIPLTTALHGIAQQGQKLGFVVKLPDIADVNGKIPIVHYYLTYGGAKALEVSGVSYNNSYNASVRQKNQDETADYLQLSYISVSRMADKDVKVWTEKGNIFTQLSGNPDWYNAEGARLNVGTVSPSGTLYAFKAGTKLGQQNLTNKYLVRILTDDMAGASTTGDISIKFNYKNTSDAKASSQLIDVKEASSQFTGTVPGSDTKMGDIAYKQALDSGSALHFTMDLSDVKEFTGAVVSLNRSTTDWQIKGLQIIKLSSLSERLCYWKDQLSESQKALLSGDGWSTDRLMTRSYSGTQVFSVNQKILIQNGTTKEIYGTVTDTETSSDGLPDPGATPGGDTPVEPVNPGDNPGGGDTPQDQDIDWSDIRKSMTYAQATQNFGFAKPRVNYTVVVKVDSDTATAGAEDDCGSRNQFYFQLVFKGGSSAYVLANQQLASDRFRSGYEESFTISTNHNYGDLVSINIIPEDMASTSDIYDKLKIAEIRVIQDSNNSVSKTWVVKDVGWISIDYHDEEEANSVNGRDGRSAAEITRSFRVSYSTYEMNLQFALTTGQYTDKEAVQLQGYVTGTLYYYDGSGQPRKMQFDLVQKLYEYANKRSATTSIINSDGTTVTGDTNRGAMSDPNWMFRGNSTDRFILSVDDISSLWYLELSVDSTVASDWMVEGLSASTIESEGTLLLNSHNEYERSYPIKPTLIATHTSTSSPAYMLPTEKNSPVILDIFFTDNKIEVKEIDDDNNGWSTNVTREPVTSNDVLNLYVYPNMTRESADPKTYSVKAAMQYNTLGDVLTQTSLEKLGWDANKNCFYALGIKADNMISLNQLGLVSETESIGISTLIDHAIIQQVRDGVMINNFYVEGGNVNISFKATLTPSPSTMLPADRQKLSMQLAPGSDILRLVGKKEDLALAIQYTSSLDNGNQVYTSPYIFLTDLGYTTLSGGDIIEVEFHQPYVDKITGVRAVSLGSHNAIVSGASIAKYEDIGSDEKLCTEWLTLGGVNVISYGGATLPVTARTIANNSALTPAYLTINSRNFSGSGDISGIGQIRAIIGYTDYFGGINEYTMSDIRDYIGSNGAGQGSITAKAMIPGIKTVRYISVEPYGSQASAMLPISSIGFEMSNIDRNVSLYDNVDGVAYEGSPVKVNFSNIVVGASIHVPASGELSPTNEEIKNGSTSILVESGTPVNVTVSISGSALGYKTEVLAVEGNATAVVSGLLTKSGNKLVFNTPVNSGSEAKTYCIVISSEEFNDVKSQIYVTIRPGAKAKVETAPVTEVTNTENSKTDDTGSVDNIAVTNNDETPQGAEN